MVSVTNRPGIESKTEFRCSERIHMADNLVGRYWPSSGQARKAVRRGHPELSIECPRCHFSHWSDLLHEPRSNVNHPYYSQNSLSRASSVRVCIGGALLKEWSPGLAYFCHLKPRHSSVMESIA